MPEKSWKIEKYGGTTVLKFTRERQIEIGQKVKIGDDVSIVTSDELPNVKNFDKITLVIPVNKK